MLEGSKISFKEEPLVNKYILFDQDNFFREKSERSEFLKYLMEFFEVMITRFDSSTIKLPKLKNIEYSNILASIQVKVYDTFNKYHDMFEEMLNLIKEIKKNDDYFSKNRKGFADKCNTFNKELTSLNTSMKKFHESAKEYESFLFTLFRNIAKTQSSKEESEKKIKLFNSLEKNYSDYEEKLEKVNKSKTFKEFKKKQLELLEKEKETNELIDSIFKCYLKYKKDKMDLLEGNDFGDILKERIKKIKVKIQPLIKEIDFTYYKTMLNLNLTLSENEMAKNIVILNELRKYTADYDDILEYIGLATENMEKIDMLNSYFKKKGKGMDLKKIIEQVGEDTFLQFINQSRSVYKNQSQELIKVIAENIIKIFKKVYEKKDKKDKDWEMLSYILIISVTYYYIEKEKEKIFLISLMKNDKKIATILKSKELWEPVFNYCLTKELSKSKEKNFIRTMGSFSINYIQNMRDCGMNYLDIAEILNSIIINENVDNSFILENFDVIIDAEYRNTKGKEMEIENLKKTIKDYLKQKKKNNILILNYNNIK